MTFFKKLEKRVSARQTYLCVGLDPVWGEIPEHLPHSQEGLLEFLLQIVNETKDALNTSLEHFIDISCFNLPKL